MWGRGPYTVSTDPVTHGDREDSQHVTKSSGQRPTPGDNPVDTVDNSAGSEDAESPGEETALRGPDLARAALQAARAQSWSRNRRKRPAKGTTGAARRRTSWSGPGSDDRDPQPLGRLAARLAAERGWQDRLAGGRVFDRWPTLVGADVAEHTTPESLDDGVLTVRAESTAWATQLRLLQRQILQRIADSVGGDVVRRINVRGPAAPSWRRGPRHIPGRGPRDTYG